MRTKSWKERRRGRQYMVQVTLKHGEHVEKFARKQNFTSEPLHGDTIHVKADKEIYSFRVHRRDIGAGQITWIICKSTSVSEQKFKHFQHDPDWMLGKDAEP